MLRAHGKGIEQAGHGGVLAGSPTLSSIAHPCPCICHERIGYALIMLSTYCVSFVELEEANAIELNLCSFICWECCLEVTEVVFAF